MLPLFIAPSVTGGLVAGLPFVAPSVEVYLVSGWRALVAAARRRAAQLVAGRTLGHIS